MLLVSGIPSQHGPLTPEALWRAAVSAVLVEGQILRPQQPTRSGTWGGHTGVPSTLPCCSTPWWEVCLRPARAVDILCPGPQPSQTHPSPPARSPAAGLGHGPQHTAGAAWVPSALLPHCLPASPPHPLSGKDVTPAPQGQLVLSAWARLGDQSSSIISVVT